MGGSLLYSLLLHGLILLLICIQLPGWTKEQKLPASVPLMIDLSKIEIAEKTNLPPLKEVKKETAKTVPQAVAPRPVPVAPQPDPKPVIQKPKPVPTPSNAAKAIETKKLQPKPKPKPVPAQPVVKPASKPKAKPSVKDSSDLDSLLASVEKISKQVSARGTSDKGASSVGKPTSGKTADGFENGIKGGVGSDLKQKLTISQIDFISATIRQYWNLDPGAEGIENMIIEIKVALDKNGHVYDVQIMHNERYEKDPSFRSVAESARRAVYICDKLGEESPFRILATKYPDSYSSWREMLLRFNPLDGNVL